MKVTAGFEGGADLAKALDGLSTRLSRKVRRDALFEAAEPMRRRMGELAPHEPGAPDLRQMMTISAVRGEDEREVTVAVGPSREGFYGRHQEFGTVHHGPQPFARPAFDETAQEALDILGRALWRELAGRGIGRSVSSLTVPVGGPGGGLI